MTVRELIEKLQAFDPEVEVILKHWDDWQPGGGEYYEPAGKVEEQEHPTEPQPRRVVVIS